MSYSYEDLHHQGEIHQLWPVNGGVSLQISVGGEHKKLANDLQKQELKAAYLVCTVD